MRLHVLHEGIPPYQEGGRIGPYSNDAELLDHLRNGKPMGLIGSKRFGWKDLLTPDFLEAIRSEEFGVINPHKDHAIIFRPEYEELARLVAGILNISMHDRIDLRKEENAFLHVVQGLAFGYDTADIDAFLERWSGHYEREFSHDWRNDAWTRAEDWLGPWFNRLVKNN